MVNKILAAVLAAAMTASVFTGLVANADAASFDGAEIVYSRTFEEDGVTVETGTIDDDPNGGSGKVWHVTTGGDVQTEQITELDANETYTMIIRANGGFAEFGLQQLDAVNVYYGQYKYDGEHEWIFGISYYYDMGGVEYLRNIKYDWDYYAITLTGVSAFKFVLFFREKGKQENLDRNLGLHIGFQDLNKPSKARKEQFINRYISDKNKTDEEDEEDENKEKDLHYFYINYSTPNFVTDYLVRLFPYSFWAIELQGYYFDEPNRLFFSLEGALIKMAEQFNDLRELIPEFFYLPELFININNINLGTLSNKSKVDDVIISKEIIQSELESYKQVFNNKIENENENKKNIFKAFITIIKMKDTLEGLKDRDLKNWLDLIFGEKQRYEDYKNKEGQFFTSVSYIDVDKNTLENNIENNMDRVQLGLIPLKIIFDENKPNEINNEIQSPASETYYWDDKVKYKFEKKNENGQGKIEIYNENQILIDEIIDHSDEIIKKSYNRRLNMLATCSYDGLICIYIFPKKLISIIRHPQKLYFDEVYLSANPFPTVIAHDKKNCCLYCYSIYGILINELKYVEIIGNIKDKKIDFTIDYILDVYGGCLWPKDLVNINYGSADKKTNTSKWFELPFLNEIKVEKAFVEKAKKFVFKD